MDKKALERELERRMTQINRWIERDLPRQGRRDGREPFQAGFRVRGVPERLAVQMEGGEAA